MKPFRNHKEIKQNQMSVIVYQNSFSALIETKDLGENDDKIGGNKGFMQMKVVKDKIMRNIIEELKIKEELCELDIIRIQALEVMLDKLVLDQMKEQEDQKQNAKDINYKNSMKTVHFKKRLEDKNRMNEKLKKIN